MLRSPRVVVAVAALLGLPAVAYGQSPAERTRLDSIRAGYAAIADSSLLIARERQLIAVARTDRDNVMLHMELGYLSYRLGEITGQKKRYQDASSEFQLAADLRPTWPYTWYQLGMAELLTGEASLIIVENLRQILGQDALSQAARNFARAVTVDPSFSQALVSLAHTAMRQRISPRLVVAQSALRQAAGTVAGNVPEVQLVRGRIERRLGDNDSALAAFQRYLAVGGDSTIGGVEAARTQALLGRLDSVRIVYFRATGRVFGDSARREIRKDLRWFATPVELAAFDRVAADSAGAWLRRFWTGRDIEDGRRVGERLSEQFRRYQYAVNHYGLLTRRRGFDVSFAFSDTSQSEFDDRGVIYLRHGEPQQRRQFAGSGYEPNESWLYRRDPPASDLIMHFAALNDVQDFRLVQSLLTICTRRYGADPLIPSPTQAMGAWRECVQSRAELSPDYERLARLTNLASPNVWASELMATLDMVREATTTDSYTLRFEQPLRPVVSLFAVADSAMQPEVHLVFAVPATRLHPSSSDAGYDYPLGLRMMIFDSTTRRIVAALDTLRVFRSRTRLMEGTYLTEQLVLRVPPGRFRYSFVIEELSGSSGDAVSDRAIEIPTLSGTFSVSDIVLGREGSGLLWRRPDGAVPLNPLMRFPRDGEAVIFYELYGLAMGAEVATRVRVVRQGGRSVIRRLFGGGGGADLSYRTVTDAPGRSRVRQTLSLRGLSPGRYRLEVEFTDPVSGTSVVRESPFEIESARAS